MDCRNPLLCLDHVSFCLRCLSWHSTHSELYFFIHSLLIVEFLTEWYPKSTTTAVGIDWSEVNLASQGWRFLSGYPTIFFSLTFQTSILSIWQEMMDQTTKGQEKWYWWILSFLFLFFSSDRNLESKRKTMFWSERDNIRNFNVRCYWNNSLYCSLLVCWKFWISSLSQQYKTYQHRTKSLLFGCLIKSLISMSLFF